MKIKDNKIDFLFRNKLEDLAFEPSEEAKEKIAEFISRRRNKTYYKRLAVAAGIIVVLSCSYLLTKIELVPDKKSLADLKSSSVMQENITGVQSIHPPQPANTRKENTPAVKKHEILPQVQKNGKPEVKKQKDEINSLNAPDRETAETKNVEPLDNRSLGESPDSHLSTPGTVAVLNEIKPVITKRAPVSIEYISNSNKEKNSKVSELLEKAKELGKDVNLGEIRDLKDQLFALDFIKQKKDNDNSK